MLVSEVSKMKNRQYIYIAEESENDDSITPKWKNMNFLEKIVLKILNPIREEIEKSIKSGLKEQSLIAASMTDSYEDCCVGGKISNESESFFFFNISDIFMMIP